MVAAWFAMAAALAGFGHEPVVRTASGQFGTLAQVVLALPDGTLPEFCEVNPDGSKKLHPAGSGHCDFCRLIDAPPPPVVVAPWFVVIAGEPALPVAMEAGPRRIALSHPLGQAPPA